MTKKDVLNGVSISEIELDQDGDLSVTFDLPIEQTSKHYTINCQGTRTFDVYEHEELKKIAKDLFVAVRKLLLEETDPELAAVDCEKCKEASCCRKHNVLVTEEDIERMRQDAPLKEFVEKYTDEAVDWTGDYVRQLSCDEDEVGEKCVFLSRDKSERMRCSIYDRRPQICRDFDMAVCDEFESMEE
jgi:Fe-S-cluster containining protein